MNPTNRLRVLVVDDQPAIRQDVESLIEPLDDFIIVGACGSVQEALVVIGASRPDILLLDINLGDGTGFDIIQQLPDPLPNVIFLTAYEEYALRALKAGAMDYLLKPIDEAEFHLALQKVKESPLRHLSHNFTPRKQLKENARIVLSSQQHLQVVELKDVIYCHSDSGYTTFYLTGNKKIVTSKYLKEYEDFLPTELFLRTHQSYMVNISFIDRYHKDGYLLLRNGVTIPVATRRKDSVLNGLKGL